jgi:ATP synthase F1 epsilon subunit
MTPDEIFWNEQAEEIILPTNTGQMGVLTNHAPIITFGHWCYVNPYKQRLDICCTYGGFALVKQNQVTVLVNSAKDKVDAAKAEQAFLEAQEQLDKAVGPKKR